MVKVFMLWICLMQAPVLFADQAHVPVLPFQEKIERLIAPLEYNGFPAFLRDNVWLHLDFEKHQWTMKNIHQFDHDGKLILQENRYGLCAELSAYLHQALAPTLPPQYQMTYAMVSETGYFSAGESNHIAVLLADQESKVSYLIDPSFHVYGRLQDLKEYQIISVHDTLTFVDQKLSDDMFQINQAMPLFIKNGILVSFSVIGAEGVFDQENFLFALSFSVPYKAGGLDVLVLGKRNGVTQHFSTELLLDQILSPLEQTAIVAKFNAWIKRNAK